MKTGLTLGKYAPFHKGHQYVIETALAEMDHVIVLIYNSPEVTTIPLTVRADWIRKLYPRVEVIEAWNGPAKTGNSPEIHKMHEDYIINTIGIRNIDAFYTSEFYGHHMSEALGAENRLVDTERKNFNISATKIREAPYANREFLDPAVYTDLIANIVFLGAPCTGKTTIARHLAEKFKTEWMHEHGRDYWEANQKNRRLTPEQLVTIAKEHLVLENQQLKNANRFLFTDTNAITTSVFARYYHKNIHPDLHDLTTIAEKRYDLVFLCGTDIPYDTTWDRSGDINRTLFQKMITADLQQRKLPFFLLEGDLQSRIDQVSIIINRFEKYQNILTL